MRTIGLAALAAVALFGAPCVAQTLAPGDPIIYPERVTVPEALRTTLMTYKVTLRKVEGGQTVSLQQIPDLAPLVMACDPSLYSFVTAPTGQSGLSLLYMILQKTDPALRELPSGERALPDLLDTIAAINKVGWTAEELDGMMRIRIVRLKGTPLPRLSGRLYQTQGSATSRYPESVVISGEVRKRLEEIKVNVSLVDRNGVGALLSLLDDRVDHQFDPALQLSAQGRQTSRTLGDPSALEKSGSEWLYPSLRVQKVTIKASNIALPAALDLLTQSLGVGWTAEAVGGRMLVRIVRLKGTQNPDDAFFNVLRSPAPPPGADEILRPFKNGTVLKEWVSLEIENADVQSAVEKLLSARPRRVVVAPGASTLRRSFRFTRVGLSTALDLLCDSYGTTWSLEHDSSDAPFLSIRKRGDAPTGSQ